MGKIKRIIKKIFYKNTVTNVIVKQNGMTITIPINPYSTQSVEQQVKEALKNYDK
jgi:hypothetical protein